ncbi:carboxypeptidase regulatory-like domain-containing protein [Haloterrigena sp. H1]|uniref:carboxypeptidase-like regulatory domain-containing protein n=1 Tax=Haloterrigena sp. H1 TaxID=2552943 RepID=UPI00110D8868|nr:carboxypeptidase-like regulatory domain-containing protein [Haloterrigena sp. H1]TMT85217.1 carboxypeptidase regulatory-like domain-containing protein [Haloterrigena sp. H1]
MRKIVLGFVVLVSLLIVPATATAESVSGTVVVDGGSADGETVTIAPLGPGNDLVENATETTVENGSFSYEPVEGAITYFIELEHEGTTHYALVDDGEQPDFVLNDTIEGELVDENGTPISNATVSVTSKLGPEVTQLNTTDGSFTIGPVQPDRVYTLEIKANGATYERAVSTDDDAANTTFELPTPTTDRDALTLGGGQPVNHLLNVGPTQNGTGLFVVETVSVENTADRPFAGDVSFAVPSDAEVVTAMVGDERTSVSQTNGTATVETTITPQEPATINVYYRLEDQAFEKPVGYDVEQFAIQFAEYDLSQVEVSDNLVEADAPMPMVTSTGPLEADDQISVSITESNQSVASDQTNGGPGAGEFPLGLVSLGFVAIIAIGLAAYRYL